MTGTKPKVLVVCPGRGTYNKEELGYLSRYHSGQSEWIDSVDQKRTEQKQKIGRASCRERVLRLV